MRPSRAGRSCWGGVAMAAGFSTVLSDTSSSSIGDETSESVDATIMGDLSSEFVQLSISSEVSEADSWPSTKHVTLHNHPSTRLCGPLLVSRIWNYVFMWSHLGAVAN